MTNEFRSHQKQVFRSLGESLIQNLHSSEHLTLSYSGEDSLFMRVNQAKVRQISEVTQVSLKIKFISGKRQVEYRTSLIGNSESDIQHTQDILKQCRKDCEALPEDPYVVFPEAGESSEENHFGEGLKKEEIAETLLKPAESLDLAGLYTSGTLMRGQMNSKGQFHWFSTDNFYFDYSLYTPSQKALKAGYAGTKWRTPDYLRTLEQAKVQLKSLEKTSLKLERGKYKVYLAPAAVAEIIEGLSWGAMSGSSIMQGHSPFKKLFDGKVNLSPLVSLKEDFSQGLTPRFNEFGDIASLNIPLINQGKLESLLVNRRTAKEYQLESNGANEFEIPRAVHLSPGNLKEENIFSELGTGLYISNLHYLNWSDIQEARITGMTRYGCFWVEKGEIVAPIEDMRFDETLFHFWGKGLENLTEKATLIPSIHSYRERSLGGVSVPGMLVNDFSLTY